MDSWVGDVELAKPIPFVRYERGQDESVSEYMERIATAMGFAFRIDPDRYEDIDDFACTARMWVLPSGIFGQTTIRGHHVIEKDADHGDGTEPDQLWVFFIEEGLADMSPTRTGLSVGPGDILVLDIAQAARLEQHDTVHSRAIISRSALGHDFRDRDLHGCVVPNDAPLAGVIAQFAARFSQDIARMNMAEAMVAFDALTKLVAHALSERYTRRLPTPTTRVRAESLIEQNLARTDLSATWIADRLGVSRATLYRAFANLDGVKSFIVARRLMEAWPEVTDNHSMPLATIAKQVGFRSKAAMGHAFREIIGLSLEGIRNLSDDQLRNEETKFARYLIRNWELRLGRKLDEGKPTLGQRLLAPMASDDLPRPAQQS